MAKFVLVNEETLRLHNNTMKTDSKAEMESKLTTLKWVREGEVWVGPSTGSRVIIVSTDEINRAQGV